jgi:F-type H+-transporting ATPase subunit gamma
MADGKQVKILCVGRKGHDVLRRIMADKIVDLINFRAVKQLSYAEGELVGRRVLELFDAGEFDVCTLVYSEFKSVIKQDPKTTAADSG